MSEQQPWDTFIDGQRYTPDQLFDYGMDLLSAADTFSDKMTAGALIRQSMAQKFAEMQAAATEKALNRTSAAGTTPHPASLESE